MLQRRIRLAEMAGWPIHLKTWPRGGETSRTARLRQRTQAGLLSKSNRRSRSSTGRVLRECAGLAPGINDLGPWEEAYVARLRREHKRKISFWKKVEDEHGSHRAPHEL